MRLLGLHVNGGQSAAALLEDGAIVAAAAEERFTRVKQSRAFPRRAIEYCLRHVKLQSLADLDGIAVSWNPAENMRHINVSGFTEWRRYDPEWLYIVPNNLLEISPDLDSVGDILRLEFGEVRQCPIYFVEHHLAHLAHAVCQSPFQRGLVAVIDEYSEFHSVTLASFDKNGYKIVRRLDYPHSLGVFYAAMTEYLGFAPNSEEWKVMGAAAYGHSTRFREPLEEIFRWNEKDREWLLDAAYIEHSNMKRAGYCNERMVRRIGIPMRGRSDVLSQDHFDLAAATQEVFETRLFQLLKAYASNAPEPNLAAAGGCFMNSLANGKIHQRTPFKEIFVPYAAADNGGAMGAALYVWHFQLGRERDIETVPASPYIGPDFNGVEIEQTLKKYKISYQRVDDIADFTAGLLADGRLVGWFQGRMEFGERALGARSILADPRKPEMKQILNEAVKYRESFRPFAPAVLSEDVSSWFEVPETATVPYMEQVHPIRDDRRKLIPAVVHEDGTGRLQTVDVRIAPRFHELLSCFKRRTGIPILLNTSFNVQGEPIVCSPTDAIRTFFSSGLEVLAIDNFIVCK